MKHIQEFRDRHGKVRRYFRRPGYPRIALPGEPGSDEFIQAYQLAMIGQRIERHPTLPTGPGTVSSVIAGYYCDPAFTGLALRTQKNQRSILERFRAEHGSARLATLAEKHIARIIGQRTPLAARGWLAALRALLQFAVRIGIREDDPTGDIKLARGKIIGFHTWTEDEITIFERHHAVGTRARLAMALLLYTAARRGDAVGFGPQHVRNGRINYRQQKTGRALAIPLHPTLAETIAASPADHLTFLTTPAGTPYTADGFSKLFRRWCDAAGLPQCTPHGLRKAAARRLAEAGCTTHEIASITGHKTLAEVQHYSEGANQARLAEKAMARIENEDCQTPIARVSNHPQYRQKP